MRRPANLPEVPNLQEVGRRYWHFRIRHGEHRELNRIFRFFSSSVLSVPLVSLQWTRE